MVRYLRTQVADDDDDSYRLLLYVLGGFVVMDHVRPYGGIVAFRDLADIFSFGASDALIEVG